MKMSITFTKLFSSITESTIWVEPDAVRIVWICMLAMADRKGRVFGSIPGLANRARVSVENTEDAINRFMSPDKYSRTKDHEGRRIEEIDGGWKLLNYEKYREITDIESVRETKRKWAEKNRQKMSTVDQSRSQSTQAEAEAEAEADKPLKAFKEKIQKEKQTREKPQPIEIPEWLDAIAWGDFLKHRGAKFTPHAQNLAISKLEQLKRKGHDPSDILKTSIMNGWTGLFEPKGSFDAKQKKFNCGVEAVERLRAGRVVGSSSDALFDDVRGEIFEHVDDTGADGGLERCHGHGSGGRLC